MGVYHPTFILTGLLWLVLWSGTASSLGLLMPPLRVLLVSGASDQLKLIASSIELEYISIYNLVRLLTYEHFDLSEIYQPNEELLQEMIEFLRRENLAPLAKYLLPIDVLSPMYHGRDWMKLLRSSEEYQTILHSIRLAGCRWKPREWPLSERLSLLGQLIQDQRGLLTEPVPPRELVFEEREWAEIVHVPDILHLFDVRSIFLQDSSYTPRQLIEEIGGLVAVDELALFRLASYRIVRGLQRTCDKLITSTVGNEVDPFRTALLQLTDPAQQDQNIILEAFEKVKEDLWSKFVVAQLSVKTIDWRLCSFLISVLDVALLKRLPPELITHELHQVLERCGPKDIIPFQLHSLMVNLPPTSVRQVNSVEWQKTFNEPDGVKLYSHYSLHPLQMRLDRWRWAYLNLMRSSGQVFDEPLDFIFDVMETFHTMSLNIIWQQNGCTIPLTPYLIRAAEEVLTEGYLARFDEKSNVLRIDCTRLPASYRAFWFGMLMRLALYGTPMPTPDVSLFATPDEPDLLEIKAKLCIEPNSSSEPSAENHWRLIKDFLDHWGLKRSYYNLL